MSLLFCLALTARAQDDMTVTGIVISSDENEPLPGAAVQVVGGKAYPTNISGKFSVKAKKGDVLEISYLGYNKLVVPVTGEDLGKLTLEVTSTVAKEVVVVGYGTTTQKEKVGSIEKISSKAFENIAMPSFDAGLQGRAAGVQITQQSGALGSAVKIQIRGSNSITGNGNPLIVIDGMVLYSGPLGNNDLSSRDSPVNATNYNTLANLDPNDIESIEILKDASATAIYGARANGGVMMITTKSGKSGKTKFNVGYYVGQNSETNRLRLLDGPSWMALYNEARVNDGLQPLSGNQEFNVNGINLTPNTIGNTDWQDQMLRRGMVQNFNVSASGGTEKSRFYLGGTYRTDEGMLRNNKFDRLSLRFNLKNDATDWLEIGTNINPTITINKMVPTSFNGGLGSAQSNALTIFPIYNADGSYFGSKRAQNFAIGNNPVAALENKYDMNTMNILGNAYAVVKLLPELKWRTSIQSNFSSQVESFYTAAVNRPINFAAFDTTVGIADLKERTVNVTNWVANTYLEYDKTFAEKHKVKATAGFELNSVEQRDMGWFTVAGAAGFPDANASILSSSIAWSQFATDAQKNSSPTAGYNSYFNQRWDSYFGRVSYTYDLKYILELSGRFDGSNNFGPGRRYGFFYAVGAAWNLSDESFIKDNLSWLNLAKLRASFGKAGDPGVSQFGWDASYGRFSNAYLGQNGLFLQRLANPTLAWADNYKTDISLDWGIFNNRVSGTITYYYQQGANILVNRPIQRSSGFTNVFINDPRVRIRNQGVEFTINSINLDMPEQKLRWSSNLNFTLQESRVLDVAGVTPDGFGDSPGDTRVIQGQPIGIHFLAKSAGVDAATGRELIYVVDAQGNLTDRTVEANATTVPANRVAMGNPLPFVFGGFNNEFFYQGFDVSMLWSFSIGNTVYDDGAKRQIGGFLNGWNQRAEVLDRWQNPGDIASVPRLTLNTSAGNWNNTSRFLYDASFVRLKNITVGYTIPREWSSAMKLTSFRVFAGATNLLTFTRFPGIDPEVTRYQFSATDGNIAAGAPYLPTPQMRTIIFGFNLGF